MILLGRGVLEERWTEVEQRRVFARVSERGRGRPAVLVHGLGVSSRYMTPLAVALADDFDVYAPDLPGFGRSPKPARVLDVSELGRVLASWIHAVGIRRAVVVANSMGCQIVVELAHVTP